MRGALSDPCGRVGQVRCLNCSKNNGQTLKGFFKQRDEAFKFCFFELIMLV